MPDLQEMYAKAHNFFQTGDLRQAEIAARQVLAAFPRQPEALQMLGAIVLQMNRHDEAVQYLRQSLAASPRNALFHNNLAMAYQAAGRLPEAMVCFQQALAIKPDYAEPLAGLASIAIAHGNLARAESYCMAALRVLPRCSEAFNTLGHIRQTQGRLAESIPLFKQAIAANPQNANAHNNLGVTLQQLGQDDAALSSYRAALSVSAHYAQAHSNLGTLLERKGRLDEAEARHRQAIALLPQFANGYMNLGHVLQSRGKCDQAIACYQRAEALGGGDARAGSNILLCMNYDPGMDAPTLLEAHRAWAKRYGNVPTLGPVADLDRDPDRPLRVGYVSPDLKNHAIANFIEPILANHDPARVEAICYAEVTAADAVTNRLQSLAKQWRQTPALSDAALAEQIRQDRIDILVDLAGHTGKSRLTVFAHKPVAGAGHLPWLS